MIYDWAKQDFGLVTLNGKEVPAVKCRTGWFGYVDVYERDENGVPIVKNGALVRKRIRGRVKFTPLERPAE